MGSQERRNNFVEFLTKFDALPFSIRLENKPMEQYIFTYFGLSFIEGYRMLEKIGDNVFLLSLMNCQHGKDELFK